MQTIEQEVRLHILFDLEKVQEFLIGATQYQAWFYLESLFG